MLTGSSMTPAYHTLPVYSPRAMFLIICFIAWRSTANWEDIVVGAWFTDNVESGPIDHVISDGHLEQRISTLRRSVAYAFFVSSESALIVWKVPP
jgi:hypothetical protein